MGRRVVVIGGGFSGLMAAYAAQLGGASVTLLTAGIAASGLNRGVLRLATPIKASFMKQDAPPTLKESMEKTIRFYPRHPFGQFERPADAVVEASNRFIELTGERFGGIESEAQPCRAWLNDFGTQTSGFCASKTFAPFAGDSALGERVGVVQLACMPTFRAKFLARAWTGLAREMGGEQRFQAFTIEDFSTEATLLKPASLARRLDRDDLLGQLIERLKTNAAVMECTALLFPAVLGFRKTDVAWRLSEALGLPVFETVMMEESTFGVRLVQSALAKLEAMGVRIVHGKANGFQPQKRFVNKLEYKPFNASKEETLEADAFVLATGKFMGGGIEYIEKTFREPLFSLPLFLGSLPTDKVFIGRLTRADFFKNQAFSRVGLMVDTMGRPTNRQARPIFENLFAAGRILSGFDPFRDELVDGVDLLTGARAGRYAAGKSEGR